MFETLCLAGVGFLSVKDVILVRMERTTRVTSEKLLTPRAVGRILRLTPLTVKRMLKKKTLSGFRKGKRGDWFVSEKEVKRFTMGRK